MVNAQVSRRGRDDDRGGFVYRQLDPKKLKEHSEQTGNQFDSIFKNGIDAWKPKQGQNTIRILPPTFKDAEHFGFEVWQHGYVGVDKSTYLCLDKMKGKRCPVCELAKEAKLAGEDKEFDRLKTKKRYLYWVIDRNGDIDTPQVWSVAWTQDRDICELCENKRTGAAIHIYAPNDGYDLMLKRTGQGKQTRYIGLQVDRDPTPIEESKKAQREILEYIQDHPLDQILKFYSEEHLEKAMEGTVAERDEDLDDKPRRGRDRDDDDKPRSRRSASRDDDGDEEEKPRGRRARDAEDEEDDKPKRRSSRDDDEEDKPRGRRSRDDDEDDKSKRRAARDDDEEDDKPKRRAARDEEEDDRPKRRASRDDDEDDKPRGRRGRDDDEDDKPKRRASRDDDEEDTRERARGSSRDDDEDDKPKRRAARDEEEDDRPSRTSRRGKTEDEEDDKPRRRASRDEDPADDDPKDRGDEEDDKPRRRARR